MTCEEYLQDPDANTVHLESCANCRALEEELGLPVDVQHRPLRVDALPLASWEGASHRTWPLVGAGLVAALTLAIVLSAYAGISPMTVVSSSMPSLDALLTFLQLTGRAIGAPLVAVLFVAINTILFLLLRRAPKGVDV
ncbi:MAG TPA: hypothetical protein VGQ36_00320 [Thermoanaerobaculia bacterium]|jgi:hypothetical protein|nr:hypothetical protein [Thermoanaerobaculia bacterium]